jgi:hypothetical protein
MAQNPRKRSSRKRNEIPPPENGETPKWNNPNILRMIEDAQNDLTSERTGDRAKFEVAFNDAERLYRAKVEFEFNPQQFEDFAADLGRPRSTAADLLKLHSHRDDGMKWFEATEFLAGGRRVNLSWQAYARDRKLIRRATTKDRTATDGDEAHDDAGGKEQPPPDHTEQDQIAQLTKERDELKAKITEVERERDEARAELDRLRHGAATDT